jgi:glycolate oxidase FAD binding subunit
MLSNNLPQDLCDIDGFHAPLVEPQSVQELADLILTARGRGEAIYPVGGGTKLSYGLPPLKQGRAVQLRKLAQVIDYPARDMTITVQAGITLAALQQLLAGENQRLPIDVPISETATLGGVLAANVSGLRRYGCGTLRDYVIGISLVNDEGHNVKAGGRVVKNVAGYDLCKLCIGSLGTLGVLTQVTLKVIPRPEQHALVALGCSADQLDGLLGRLHESRTRPVAVELLNAAAMRLVQPVELAKQAQDRWLVVVGFESNADAVNWQVQQLIKEVKTDFSLEAFVGPPASPLWHTLEELTGRSEAPLTIKAAMLPGRCPEFCRQLSRLVDVAVIQAHAGNGIVTAHLPGIKNALRGSEVLARCREWVGDNGFVVVLRCPPEWKQADLVWGPPRGDVRVMRHIKERLDPSGVFNPGRFVAGI